MSLCHRHSLVTKKSSSISLHQELNLAPEDQQQNIQKSWDIFHQSSPQHRLLILKGLLSSSCTSQLSFLWENVQQLLRTDFTLIFPMEVTLQIFTHLDAQTLCAAAQVSRRWRELANDDTIWHRLCEQHIDKKCAKCGWGLPLLQKRKPVRYQLPPVLAGTKRSHDGLDQLPSLCESSAITPASSVPTNASPQNVLVTNKRQDRKPWKVVYSERLVVERHWRKLQAKTFTVEKAHTEAILAVAFCEGLNIMMTASADKTVKVWSLLDGRHLRTLQGHTRAVTSLQFDDAKLVTGSLDHTLKIWNYRTGQCIRTLEGHTEGVAHLHFDSRLLASGSVDGEIKLWNFSSGECSTLSGHAQAVNHVHVFQQSTRLLSSSEDGRLILWDLDAKQRLHVFEGHQASIQASIPSMPGFLHRFYEPASTEKLTEVTSAAHVQQQLDLQHRSGTPIAISCSLDKTLKVWSLSSGRCLTTLFGHRNGVKALAYDKLRMVTGSSDGELKIWDIENGHVLHSIDLFDGSAINAVGLSDTKIICVSASGAIRVADFGV
ncbi:WD40 repeat-like protein [Hesseltinella vesiculosa]|uniref:WD40 repeat-like protein n=1 Tax=Hesseltinella vesiculosa TaxID=101127 RepID=A0A1X2GJL7_9FUNG|nr:WD40 repeat-like protein [Hesseltinella vesiculosa]